VSLRLPGRWLWDFWFARDGDDVHVFFLQAPQSLGDPELRHRHATIGHAVSHDLHRWRVLPDALAAGPPGAFDDLATWTGSVSRHEGRWRMS
jgi:beta-fructofuranosidase